MVHNLRGRRSNRAIGDVDLSAVIQVPVTPRQKTEAEMLAELLQDGSVAALMRRLLARETERYRSRITDP